MNCGLLQQGSDGKGDRGLFGLVRMRVGWFARPTHEQIIGLAPPLCITKGRDQLGCGRLQRFCRKANSEAPICSHFRYGKMTESVLEEGGEARSQGDSPSTREFRLQLSSAIV